jgi:diacylglycerol kinase
MKKENSEKFSTRRRIRSFRYAFAGLKGIFLREHNFRIHLLAAILAVAVGFWLKLLPGEWTILTLVIALVFVCEIFNSALEALADIISPEYSEQVRKAKDYAASAVLVASVAAITVGGILFLPKLLAFLGST